jgi:hypothetical protein
LLTEGAVYTSRNGVGEALLFITVCEFTNRDAASRAAAASMGDAGISNGAKASKIATKYLIFFNNSITLQVKNQLQTFLTTNVAAFDQ